MVPNNTFNACSNFDQLLNATYLWIAGKSYKKIHTFFIQTGIKKRHGETQLRDYSIDHIVEIFEQGLSYNGGLILGAISTLASILPSDLLRDEEKDTLIERLYLLQKRIKYGLSTKEEISIYEAGFCDRVIASRIYKAVGAFTGGPESAKCIIREKILEVREALDGMPEHYQGLLQSM